MLNTFLLGFEAPGEQQGVSQGLVSVLGRLPCSAFSLQVIVQRRRVLLPPLPVIIFIQLPLMLLLRDKECWGGFQHITFCLLCCKLVIATTLFCRNPPDLPALPASLKAGWVFKWWYFKIWEQLWFIDLLPPQIELSGLASADKRLSSNCLLLTIAVIPLLSDLTWLLVCAVSKAFNEIS